MQRPPHFVSSLSGQPWHDPANFWSVNQSCCITLTRLLSLPSLSPHPAPTLSALSPYTAHSLFTLPTLSLHCPLSPYTAHSLLTQPTLSLHCPLSPYTAFPLRLLHNSVWLCSLVVTPIRDATADCLIHYIMTDCLTPLTASCIV